MAEVSAEYYYTDKNNKVVGPLSYSQIIQLRKQGNITDDMLVCKKGETKWSPLENVLKAHAHKKRIEQPKKKEQETVKKEATTIPTTEKVEYKSKSDKFNIINTVLLTIIVVLLICQLIISNSNSPVPTITHKGSTGDTTLVPVKIQSSTTVPVSLMHSEKDYEYGAVHIDREDMAYAEKKHKENHPRHISDPIEPPHKLQIGTYKDWDYVGILCNDGINGSWILVRRKKAPEKAFKF